MGRQVLPTPVAGVCECAIGGHLVTVRRPKVEAEADVWAGLRRGGKRGHVGRFSMAARRRMMRLVATILTEVLPLFVTLTYPALWPTDWQRWKRDLDVFCRRLKRKFPSAGIIWKLEPQYRGAPHFHLLVYGVDFIPHEWLAQTWYEVVGSGDAYHRFAGTQVQRVRSARGVRSYAGKYLGKVADTLEYEGVDWSQVGRWWGVRHPECIPWAEVLAVRLDDYEARKLQRVLRNYLERVAGIRVRPGLASLSAFYDGSLFASALPKLL